MPLRQRLQRDEHAPAIALPAAGETDHALHRRIGTHDSHERDQFLLHRLEGNILVRLNAADQPAGVLLRKEALGHHDEEIDVQADHAQQHQHDHHAVVQTP